MGRQIKRNAPHKWCRASLSEQSWMYGSNTPLGSPSDLDIHSNFFCDISICAAFEALTTWDWDIPLASQSLIIHRQALIDNRDFFKYRH
jgi:hypothetical protein